MIYPSIHIRMGFVNWLVQNTRIEYALGIIE